MPSLDQDESNELKNVTAYYVPFSAIQIISFYEYAKPTSKQGIYFFELRRGKWRYQQAVTSSAFLGPRRIQRAQKRDCLLCTIFGNSNN